MKRSFARAFASAFCAAGALSVAAACARAGTPTAASVAALPPELTAGRGAALPFVEYEAEAGRTNGVVIGPDRRFGGVAAEASGRRAVRLERVGDYVEFVLASPANALTLRYALPDSADGKGLDAKIAVWADGEKLADLSLTSRYGWFYGRYPFTNDPRDGLGHHVFDETRLRLARRLKAGTHVRFQIDAPDAAAWRVLDLADFELVAPPPPPPPGALSVLAFGADPTGARSSLKAFEAAIAEGRRQRRPVWIDPGAYRIDGHLLVDEVQLIGAGPWWSVLRGPGVGVFGRPTPASRRVVLRGFAILGEVTDRDDHAPLSGVGGAMSDSEISDLWIQHTKGGLWFQGPLHDLRVSRLRVLDQTADGLNFHGAVTDAVVEDSFFRNTGDDGLAVWSHPVEDARIVFRRNTIVAPVLANGVAIYGGRDITVSRNLVADTLTEGGGLHVGARFKATPVAGRILFEHNTVVRGGSFDPHWRTGVGALWLYALDRPIAGAQIEISDLTLLDSSEEAIQFRGEPIAGVRLNGVLIDRAGGPAVALQARGRAVFAGVVARGVTSPPVVDCGSGFELLRRSGDQGLSVTGCPARP
jgi:hypothetical protein